MAASAERTRAALTHWSNEAAVCGSGSRGTGRGGAVDFEALDQVCVLRRAANQDDGDLVEVHRPPFLAVTVRLEPLQRDFIQRKREDDGVNTVLVRFLPPRRGIEWCGQQFATMLREAAPKGTSRPSM